jgi:hypothetical protein
MLYYNLKYGCSIACNLKLPVAVAHVGCVTALLLELLFEQDPHQVTLEAFETHPPPVVAVTV